MIEQSIAREHAYKYFNLNERRSSEQPYAYTYANKNELWRMGERYDGAVECMHTLALKYTTQRNERTKERMCDWMAEHKIQGVEALDRKL